MMHPLRASDPPQPAPELPGLPPLTPEQLPPTTPLPEQPGPELPPVVTPGPEIPPLNPPGPGTQRPVA